MKKTFPPYIGFAGKMGSGKSLLANFFHTLVPDYTLYSFANPLRDIVNKIIEQNCILFKHNTKNISISEKDKFKFNLLQFLIENKFSYNIPELDSLFNKCKTYSDIYRILMQFIGTDIYRKCVSQDYWVLKADEQHFEKVIFDDVRFKNEIDYIHNKNGIVVYIQKTDPNYNFYEDQINKCFYKHISENSIKPIDCDIIFLNNFNINIDINAINLYNTIARFQKYSINNIVTN